MAILKKGLVQVYTGEGKGKTTASLGLCWRMLGWGGKVYICQFLKPADFLTGEMQAAATFKDNLLMEQLDCKWDMRAGFDDSEQVGRARQVVMAKLDFIYDLAKEGVYDLIVLDELMFVLKNGLAAWEKVEAIIDDRNAGVELVFTGRGSDQRLLQRADLITEMNLKKHPFDIGIAARKGIEY